MKNKNLLIIVFVIVFVILGVFGAWKFIFSSKDDVIVEKEEEVVLPPVDENVEVSLTARSDKRAVVLAISNIPKDTESIEYELSYDTSAGLPKGAIGKIKLKSSELSVEREILLGTCSRSVCRYDEGVTQINLVLRFNTADGPSQFQEIYDI